MFIQKKITPRILGSKHLQNDYIYNNMLYRSNDDFINDDPSKKILFLGCSMTESVGVKYEESWPVLLINSIYEKTGVKYKNYNLGDRGKSAEYISRILYQSIDLYNPNLVILLWPSFDRREYFLDSSTCKSVGSTYHQTENKKLMFNELRTPFNDFYNFIRQIVFTETLLDNRKILRIHATWDTFIEREMIDMSIYMNKMYWLEYDLHKTWWDGIPGTDGKHPGIYAHDRFSKLLFDKLNKLNFI